MFTDPSADIPPATPTRPFGSWRPAVVLFDLDGTLIDTMGGFADLAAELINEHHGTDRRIARKRYLETSGIPFRHQLEAIFPGDPRNDEVAAIYEHRKQGICARAVLDADTRRGLLQLRERGIRIVVSSNGARHFIDEFQQRAPVTFDLALGFGDGLAKGAPHVARVCRELDVTPDQILFVGDSLKDGELARDNGLRFVGRTGTFNRSAFQGAFPGVPTVDRISDLSALLSEETQTMHVIILAAGLGSRLGALTKETPKPLIEVASRALIDHSLSFARRAGAASRVVVGGYRFLILANAVRGLDPTARLVRNREFRRGNILSLVEGMTELRPDDGFLVMNADHIYPEAIAAIVARAAGHADQVTTFCDFDRQLGPDDMKVQLGPGRHVRRMSKQLERWDAGYVGMTWVPAARRQVYAAALAATREQLGDDVHVESIVNTLAEAGVQVQIADVSGHGWYEVDEPAERDWAEARLASAR